MENKIKLASGTFRILGILMIGAWVVFVVSLVLLGDSPDCTEGTHDAFFTTLAFVVGGLTAPPLVYGFVRLLFWPKGTKTKLGMVAGWVVGGAIGIFVAAVVAFAVSISQFGCQ